MIVSPALSPTATQSAAQTTALATSGSSFVAALVSAGAAQSASGTDAASNAHRSFRSGRLSIDMHADGQRINGVSYFDEAGQKLTTSGFWPQDILRQCERFNIPLSDLQGLGRQLDAAGVHYKPYEQYAGTGSNHGIDLDNLASGGMGTAYDWTQDPLVHLKGPSARAQLAADQALAQRLGLRPVGASPSDAVNNTTSQPAPLEGSTETSTLAPTPTATTNAMVTPASAPSPAAQALSALDALMQLITQMKTSLQNPTPAAQPTPLPSLTSPASPALARTTPVQANNGTPAATPATSDPATTQRLSQMKSLLEQLLAQR